MGKHKRKRRSCDTIEELNERLRKLEKRYKRSRHGPSDDYEACSSRAHSNGRTSCERNRRSRSHDMDHSRSPSSRLLTPICSRSASPSDPTPREKGGGNVDEVVLPEKENIPANIEELLGQEGTPCANNSITLHESLAKRWTAILQNGLEADTRTNLIKKHDPPINCSLLVPPKLNEEVVAAMNESGVKRDKRICAQQNVLSAAISTIGMVLNEMIIKQGHELHIEALSDSTRLLCDLYHENSITRRSLILPGLNKDMKELMEGTPISEYLFGDKLQEKVTAIKAVKKSGQELKNTPPQPKIPIRPPKNLNYRGPQRQQQPPRPSGQKPKPRRTAYQPPKPSTRYKHSPQRRRQPFRRGQDRR